MTLIHLSPSAKQLRDARWQGRWQSVVVWLPLGVLAGWMAHALLSGAQP